jgi:hypothetical protein
MKYALILSLLLISACAQQPLGTEAEGPMTGDKVNVRAEAYIKMCEREPLSPLCKK